jgi:hypothetical protein
MPVATPAVNDEAWQVRRACEVVAAGPRANGGDVMQLPRAVLMGIALWLHGCSGAGSGTKPDLPAGWENAQSVKSFTQATCSGAPDIPGGPIESIDATASAGSVNIAYHAANFRCDQRVAGFVRTGPGSAEFLVQPVDMNPSSVAGCDCLYEVAMVANAMPGPTTVTVYRRWDEHSGNTDPVKIGTASVNVP